VPSVYFVVNPTSPFIIHPSHFTPSSLWVLGSLREILFFFRASV